VRPGGPFASRAPVLRELRDLRRIGELSIVRLWILDVDGTRLVVDANYMPTADAADRRQLFDVVDSIRFDPSSP